MNEVTDTLGNGIHIGKRSTAFIEKNTISGSLNCNVVFEGPENLNNYLYNNKILKARGHGIFVIHGESFLIAKNEIS